MRVFIYSKLLLLPFVMYISLGIFSVLIESSWSLEVFVHLVRADTQLY
jgi:hypothetical protein